MIKVNIAWNRQAADIAEEKGFGVLEKSKKTDLSFETKEFASTEIAEAYLQGIADANGWDDPWTEIESDDEPQPTYLVAITLGDISTDDNKDEYFVFRGEDGNALELAKAEYNRKLQESDVAIAVLARIIESTDY